MDNSKLYLNKEKKLSIKESIQNYLRKYEKEKGNLMNKNNNVIRGRYKSFGKYVNYNNNDIKISNNANKLKLKSINKNNILEQFIRNIDTKQSYSLKLKPKNNRKMELKKNSINLNTYNLSLPKKEKYNKTIDVNASNEIKDYHLNKNNLFLSFNNNIKKEIEQKTYLKTLENYSRETSHSNNNYINNIINININLDKKRKKYRNQLTLSLKNTINYVTENLFNNIKNNHKNIKMNFHLKNKILNSNNTSSLKSIKSNKGDEIGYNHTISNEIINKNKIRSKNTFIKLLQKNKIHKNNYFNIGRLIKSSENKEINNFNENNLKIIENKILFKEKNSNNINHKILLLNNINPIIDYNSNEIKTKKKKNYFIQKKNPNGVNKIKNYKSLRISTIKNQLNNFMHSPKEQGIKLLLKTSGTFNSFYINNQPEFVKEYNQEILLNLLIDEYIYKKRRTLILNEESLTSYGINPTIRLYLIDSLIGLQDTFKFHDKTIFITLQLFDNYISSIMSLKNNKSIIIKESELDLIFTACFLIASKSEESFIYHLTDYLSILSDKYKVKDLETMEYNILKYFNFEVFCPNALDFFEFFSVFFNFDIKLNKRGTILLIIILSDLYLSQLNSSFLSFCVTVLLFKNNLNIEEMMNKLNNIFDNINENNNSYINKNKVYEKFMMLVKPLKNIKEIKDIGISILKCIKNIKRNDLSNISKKVDQYNNLI